MKLVINRCFGGFGLSYAGVMEYARRAGLTLYASTSFRGPDGHLDFHKNVPYDGSAEKDPFIVHYHTKPLGTNGEVAEGSYFSNHDIKRDDPHLVATVKALKKRVNGSCADLRIVEIPDGVQWEIAEYDGMETVEEVHRSWS